MTDPPAGSPLGGTKENTRPTGTFGRGETSVGPEVAGSLPKGAVMCRAPSTLGPECSPEDVNNTPMSPDMAEPIADSDFPNPRDNVGQLDRTPLSGATAGSSIDDSAAADAPPI